MAQTGPANRNLGRRIEEYRASERGGEIRPDVGFYDVQDGNTPVEVKSTRKHLPRQGGKRRGRYQLIGDHHEKLVEQGGEYDFVLRDENDEEIETVTLPATEIDRIIYDAGLKWPTGSKLKITWDSIHEGEI